MGIGGVLVLLMLSWFTGVDFLSLVGGGGGPVPSGDRRHQPADRDLTRKRSVWSTSSTP